MEEFCKLIGALVVVVGGFLLLIVGVYSKVDKLHYKDFSKNYCLEQNLNEDSCIDKYNSIFNREVWEQQFFEKHKDVIIKEYK